MRIVLVGSVSSSAACLEALVENGVDVVGVLGLTPPAVVRTFGGECQPVSPRDVPANMGSTIVSDYRDLEPITRRHGIAYHAFQKVADPTVEAFVRGRRPDSLWVIGLSQLVPRSLIDLAPTGGVGFHPTMLPRGRGRAPVAWTILLGEPAAVSLFHLTDKPDAGDLVAQCEVPVFPDDYSEDLIARTNDVLKDVIRDLAPALRSGGLPRTPQDHSRATYYAKRTPEDGLIDWTQSTDAIYRLIRAVGRPYPGAFTFAGRDRITVWRARPECSGGGTNAAPTERPGDVLAVSRDGALVRTADGAMWLTKIEGGELREFMTLTAVPSPVDTTRG